MPTTLCSDYMNNSKKDQVKILKEITILENELQLYAMEVHRSRRWNEQEKLSWAKKGCERISKQLIVLKGTVALIDASKGEDK